MAGEYCRLFLNDDKPHEACGVFGIYAPGQDVARITYYGPVSYTHLGDDRSFSKTLLKSSGTERSSGFQARSL